MREQARMQRNMLRAQRDAIRAQMRVQMRAQRRALRRSSIIGPLLLIALGVVFLLIEMGRISWYQAGFWYSRWWPLVLVGIGIVVLIEWIVDQRLYSGDAPYRRTLGGGVVLLLILLVGTGLVSNAARNHECLRHSIHIGYIQ